MYILQSKSWNLNRNSGSLKYKHWYLRFAVESEIIEETHAMFETQMKEFIKKNKGKVRMYYIICQIEIDKVKYN